MLAHIRELAAVTQVPVNADFGDGYADHPDGVGENVRRCVEAASPACRSKTRPGEKDAAVRLGSMRWRGCARGADGHRCDRRRGGAHGAVRSFLVGRPDLPEVLRRL